MRLKGETSMFKYLFFAACTVASLLCADEPKQDMWLSNLDQAKNQSKPIYLLITGESWCPWCIKMRDEVYAKPQFWNTFKDRLIFVKVDIGRKATPEQTHIMDEYGVSGVPTMLILTPEGKEIARLGYPSGDKSTLELHTQELNDVLKR